MLRSETVQLRAGGVPVGDVAVVDGMLTEGWLVEGAVVEGPTVGWETIDVVGADEWWLDPQPATVRDMAAIARGSTRPDFLVMRSVCRPESGSDRDERPHWSR
jgi:hypothetical protein